MNHKGKKIYDHLCSISANSTLSILIIRKGLLGDIVFITPLIKKIIEAFPKSKIDIALSSSSVDILKNFPGINKIIAIDKGLSVWQESKFFFSLRKNKYHVIFIQEVNTHFTFMGKIAGGKYLIGFNSQVDFLLDLAVPRSGHAVKAELETILQLKSDSYSFTPTCLYVTNNELNEAENILTNIGLNKNDFLICFHPGCSEKNSIREWTAEGYSILADYLIKAYNAKIIVTGTEQDFRIIKKIIGINPNIKSVAGKTSVRQLLGLLSYTKLVVGPDTGTLHIANALGIPALMLMGYSVPEDTGIYSELNLNVTAGSVPDCIPCKYKNPKPELWNYCVKNRPAICMQNIKPEFVFEKACEILNNIK